MENQINEQREEAIFDSLVHKHMKEIYKMRRAGDNDGLIALQDTLENQAYKMTMEKEPFKFTQKQIKAYTTIGGMETIENIEVSKTGKADRPINNVRILKATIIE